MNILPAAFWRPGVFFKLENISFQFQSNIIDVGHEKKSKISLI